MFVRVCMTTTVFIKTSSAVILVINQPNAQILVL